MKQLIKTPPQPSPFEGGGGGFYFNTPFLTIHSLIDVDNTFFITDENVFNAHKKWFNNLRTIIIPAGEKNKTQRQADSIIKQLLQLGADRKSMLIGVGGGVVTDITGYVAAVYQRGIKLGLVPTTLLAMVDASIGGKNGINVGLYKNMVGTIRQPDFILFDTAFLKKLPKKEWINGFAEIIKHACILDEAMFSFLERYKLTDFQKDEQLIAKLIEQNVLLKSTIVQEDEFEQGQRKLLNFGHTLGHAIENLLHISHGEAVAIGMVTASHISEKLLDFTDTMRIIELLKRYQLPTSATYNKDKAFKLMQADKKRVRDVMHYILLEKTGKAVIREIPTTQLKNLI